MSVELLQMLSLAAYIAAGIFLLIGIALFFLLDVPKLYGDVSGRTAKKAIENIRQQNESTGNKAYKPSAVNAERGRLTDKITMSGRLESQTAGLPVSVGTEKFATSMLAPQFGEHGGMPASGNETVILHAEPSTAGETAVLVQPGQGMTSENNGFTVDVEMSFAESAEIIQ